MSPAIAHGNSIGIGAGTAGALAALGAFVAVLDRDAACAASVAEDIQRAGGRTISLAANVTDSEAIAAAAAQVLRELGPCDVFVNNADLVLYAGPLMQADMGQWNRMLAVNLTGALTCTRAFGAQMMDAARGGSIVNVASICGHMPLPNGGAYSVGKARVMMLTSLLAVERAHHGIRRNSVSPGLVLTPATEAAYVNPRVAAERQQMVPTGRVADPADLANVIAFLASDRAGYINGQDILVDGGLSRILMDRRNVMTAGNSSCVAVRKPVAPFRGELIVLARVIRQCLDTHVRIVIAELVDETVHCRLVPIGSCDQGALGRARPSAAGTPPMNPA